MQKNIKSYQLDIFGNEISLEEVKKKKSCDTKWNNKLKKIRAKYFNIGKESDLNGINQTKFK